MPPKSTLTSPTKTSHASRAAALLSKARASTSSSPSTRTGPSASTTKLPSSTPTVSDDTTPIPLPDLLKHLTTHGGLTMHDAIAITRKLLNARFTTPAALAHISLLALQDIGIDSEDLRRRTVLAFKGKNAAGIVRDSAHPAASELSTSPRKRRRTRVEDDESLSREYGNVTGPDGKASRGGAGGAVQTDFVFNEMLDEEGLRGRYAVVNRAPVMTAWATVLLERLAFSRAEALSLAHCYVNYTSTMRGVSLGILPASERDKAANRVGPNQPHFELMGVKIPVMQMADGTYRGISAGEVVGPEKAFSYMRRSMAQTLSSVFGALTLLADSYVQAPASSSPLDTPLDTSRAETRTEPAASEYGADYLNARGYDLYATFRPSTSGEWGKKGRLWYDKILALRRGREAELQEWNSKEEKLEEGGQAEEEWSEDVERLVQEELEREERERELAAPTQSTPEKRSPTRKRTRTEDEAGAAKKEET